MINYNEEYFNNNCYFFLKDKGDKISLYYAIADTLTESRKKDKKKDFSKKNSKKVKSIISKFLSGKNKSTEKDLDRELDGVENGDNEGEIEELVNTDGSLLGSNTPLLNATLHPRKTMDQTVAMSRIANDPVTRGYRVYYGESEEKDGDVVREIDFSDAFGYEETVDKDYSETMRTLKKMGIEDPIERMKRTRQLGKLPKVKRKGKKLKQRLTEKDSLEEERKQRMIKMVEDILAKKAKGESDVIGKEKSVSKILMRNLESIKKIAEKEGISINQLIKVLKSGE